MPNIPNLINGVTVEFKSTVIKSVDQKIIGALNHSIKSNIATGYVLKKIYISTAHDSHELPSRHAQGQGKAIDISRINGLKLSIFYSGNTKVKAITDAIQNKFESFLWRRENFGPLFKKKLGNPYPVSGHNDHIHFSVN